MKAGGTCGVGSQSKLNCKDHENHGGLNIALVVAWHPCSLEKRAVANPSDREEVSSHSAARC